MIATPKSVWRRLKPQERRILLSMAEIGLGQWGWRLSSQVIFHAIETAGEMTPRIKKLLTDRLFSDLSQRSSPRIDSLYAAVVGFVRAAHTETPLMEGAGNFGDVARGLPPAACNYTDCRLTPAGYAVVLQFFEKSINRKQRSKRSKARLSEAIS